MAHGQLVIDPGAHVLRETTGTTGLEQTARSAVETLAHFDIPHLIAGGLAVQEHGYHRVTLDIDLVVPDILEAVEYLTADVVGPFVRVPNCDDRVQDRRNGVFVDLLPAGKVLRGGFEKGLVGGSLPRRTQSLWKAGGVAFSPRTAGCLSAQLGIHAVVSWLARSARTLDAPVASGG
jgi:hypothetical protein